MATTAPTTHLAGTNRNSPPRSLKLSIGRRGERGFPEKLGYIQIQRPAKDTKTGRYVVDETLQAALVAMVGDQQPKWVPVFLWSNDANDFLLMRRSFYQGGKCVCACDEFRAKTEEECRQDGLSWPLPGPFHELPESYLTGLATWNLFEKRGETHVKCGQRRQVCNPLTCPFATGNMDAIPDADLRKRMTKNQGTKLCKPQIVLSCQLDLPEVRVGTFAKFVSTGWRTAQYLASSLSVIRAMTGGNLMGLPLRLCYGEETGDTPMGRQKIPFLYFEAGVALKELPGVSETVLRQLNGNVAMVRQLQAHQAEVIDAEFTPWGESAFQAEFHHENASDDVPEVEVVEVIAAPTRESLGSTIRDLARQTGKYTDAWVDGQLANCTTTNDLLSLEDVLTRELRTPPAGEGGALFREEG